MEEKNNKKSFRQEKSEKPSQEPLSTQQADSNRSTRNFFSDILLWCKKHLITLKGLGALIGGVLLILFKWRVVFDIALFLAGVALVGYGLDLLGIADVSRLVDRLVGKL